MKNKPSGKGRSFVARIKPEYRAKGSKSNLDAVKRKQVWESTRAPDDPWSVVQHGARDET